VRPEIERLPTAQLTQLTKATDFPLDQSEVHNYGCSIFQPLLNTEIAIANDILQPMNSLGEWWPFHESATDIVGSPKLSRLFAALELEPSADVPSLDLSSASSVSSDESEQQYVSNSEMMMIYCNSSQTTVKDRSRNIESEISHTCSNDNYISYPARPRGLNHVNSDDARTPLRYPSQDVFFPSGAYIYSSPLNELYPFPGSPRSSIQQASLSSSVFSSYQAKKAQNGETISKLEALAFKKYSMISQLMEEQARICRMLGQYHQAESWYEKALGAARNTEAPDTTRMLSLSVELIKALFGQCKYNQASEILERIRPKIIGTLAEDHPLVLDYLGAMGHMAQNNRDDEEAEALARQRVQIQMCSHGPRHPYTLATLKDLSNSMISTNPLLAERLLHNMAQICPVTDINSMDHHTCRPFTILEDLGGALLAQGRYEESRKLFSDAIERAKLILGRDHRISMILEYHLAIALKLQRHFSESETIF
jgi:tetratricopeptide (TPR) repeat protein